MVSTETSDYLSKLKQAEEKASQFPEGTYEHTSWMKIAEGYRALLKRAEPATYKADTED